MEFTRKNVSCGSFYNTEAGKCTTLINYHIFRSHFHFQFTFGTPTAHQKKSNQDECIHMSNLPDLMYAHIIKYCLVYLCVAFSRVLRIMTQNESCDKRQLYVVDLAVGSEQKLYKYFCYELSARTSTGSESS